MFEIKTIITVILFIEFGLIVSIVMNICHFIKRNKNKGESEDNNVKGGYIHE